MNFLPMPCLMLVTEPSPCLPEIVAEAVAGGVNAVQWREKGPAIADFQETYARLAAVTADKALLVVNGPWDCLEQCHLSAVHLAERGVSVEQARHRLGPAALIGQSVHSLDSAAQAEEQGADYLVAGTIFASQSHPDLAPAGVKFLQEIHAAVFLPVLAIGGMTPSNLESCVTAGAAGVAVLSPLMRADKPRRAAQQYRDALELAWEKRR